MSARQLVGPPSKRGVIPCATEENARFRMTPLGTLRLNNKTGIKTGLLVSGRAKVIVREDCAQRAIVAGVVEHVVGDTSVALLSARRACRRTDAAWLSGRWLCRHARHLNRHQGSR